MPVRGGDLEQLHIGLAVPLPGEDLRAALGAAVEERFDFVVLPLAAPGGERHRGEDFQPAARTARALDGETWSTRVVGSVSEACSADAAPSGAEAEERCAALEAELRWAAHLSLRGVLLPPPRAAGGCRYARALNELLLEGLFAQGGSGGGCMDGDSLPRMAVRADVSSAGWRSWNRLRMYCDHHPNLGVALELSAAEAKQCASERELDRWLAEPVRYVVLPPSAFVPNPQGFPVLPKRLKALLLGLFRRKVQVLIAGGDAPEVEGTAARKARMEYVARLFLSLPALTPEEKFSITHLDCLQAPLQPLHDNLDSETYEIFETDPVKYVQYEEAVLAFLRDWSARASAAGATSPEPAAPCTVMVLGAGRGPLVAASLRAAARAEMEVDVWAVEKNPNAVHTLRHRQRTEGAWRRVQVVAHDMRTWQAPRKADAIVSELLGSFGDNELDPECLDGALRFLAEDGVSIPTSYVSSLAPVSAPGLWADARGRAGAGFGDPKDLETGYVACIHKAFYPSSGSKDCFAFEHPNRALKSNSRFADLSFEMEADALVHGFAGYFDCLLYGSVRISIRPETRSEGMFSWFPMFFPLQAPVLLRKGETIRCHWWRRHSARQVWYEWALAEPAATPIQNAGGRSWAIGLV